MKNYPPSSESKKKDLKYVNQNIKKQVSFYSKIDNLVDSIYPDLIQLNIPRICLKFKNLAREEIYSQFIQYKILLKLCIAINKDLKLANLGIDNKTFHRGVPEMSTEDEYLAKKIFNTIVATKSGGYMSLEQFINGMITIKSENIGDKLGMFFNIIDTDGNGKLSWKEVLSVSKQSLKRTIKGGESEDIIDEISEFFAKLIFRLVGIDKDKELELAKLKEVSLF